MDLQHLHSEISNADPVYADLEKLYNNISSITDIVTAEDIDNLNSILLNNISLSKQQFKAVMVDSMVAHAHILKPYLNYSEQDFFI